MKKSPQITQINTARQAATKKWACLEITNPKLQITKNCSHVKVSEALFKKGFPGCSMRKSWNENKVLQRSNTDYLKKISEICEICG